MIAVCWKAGLKITRGHFKEINVKSYLGVKEINGDDGRKNLLSVDLVEKRHLGFI